MSRHALPQLVRHISAHNGNGNIGNKTQASEEPDSVRGIQGEAQVFNHIEIGFDHPLIQHSVLNLEPDIAHELREFLTGMGDFFQIVGIGNERAFTLLSDNQSQGVKFVERSANRNPAHGRTERTTPVPRAASFRLPTARKESFPGDRRISADILVPP